MRRRIHPFGFSSRQPPVQIGQVWRVNHLSSNLFWASPLTFWCILMDAVWNMNTQKVSSTSKSLPPPSISHHLALPLWCVHEWVCECWWCVCLRTDNYRGGPAVCCPQGSDLIKAVAQFAGTQTAKLNTHCTVQGGGGGQRDTGAELVRERFGCAAEIREHLSVSNRGLCGGQRASARTTPYSPLDGEGSKTESKLS